MQDTELFLSLAEIAGVFVGFGALIAVRGGGPSAASEVTMIQWVLVNGVWVVGAALVPVTLGRLGVAGHQLWLVSSLLAIGGFWALLILWRRTPEARDAMAGIRPREALGAMLMNWVMLGPLMAALGVVVLGLVPDQEPALYLAAVVLGLFLTAWSLLDLVLMSRRPQAA